MATKLVYLSLGSNLGEREIWLTEAIRLLAHNLTQLSVSAIYETSPVDDQPERHQPAYYNLAVSGIPIPAVDDIDEFHRFTKQVEEQVAAHAVALGNPPQIKENKGPRYIDIDIVFFGGLILNTERITIPHRHYRERLFVLVPILELSPNLTDPVSGKKLTQIKTECEAEGMFAGQEINKLNHYRK